MLDRIALFLRMLPALPKLVRHKPGSLYTAGDRIEEAARAHGERPFARFEGRTQSYAELNAEANRVAHWASELGLERGDCVALLMENRLAYIRTWAGLAKLGVVTALLNHNLTGPALRHALAASGARHLVVGSECRDALATTIDDLAAPLEIWVDRDPADAEQDSHLPGAHDLGAALGRQPENDPDPALRADLRAGDDLFYIYTSGTTGLPKAARFSHMRFLATGDSTQWALALRPDDVYYCVLPLYHTAGGVLVVSSVIAAGATLELRRHFSASRFAADVRACGATAFQYIGELCRYLVNTPPTEGEADNQLRIAFGNGLRPDIWPEFQRRFGIDRIVEFYGATEGNAGFVNIENKVGSVGRYPFKFVHNGRLIRYDVEADAHPRDASGFCIECGPDEPGEFIGRLPVKEGEPRGRFEGYTDKSASDRKILRDVFERGDAWVRSGDLLREDRDGFFYFVDRIGDTFRWKGENVSTQEVAEAISEFPDLEIVNVYGVAVPGQDGRAGMAALRFRDGREPDGETLYRHVAQRLPGYAAPCFVRLLRNVETTGTFKLRKVTLQEEGFDPERVADPLLFRDDGSGRFVPLTADLHRAIMDGARRL